MLISEPNELSVHLEVFSYDFTMEDKTMVLVQYEEITSNTAACSVMSVCV